MSQYPRRVMNSITVNWDKHANGNAAPRFVRAGAMVDIPPGSLLEAAYGQSNLSGVLSSGLGDAADADQDAEAN